jgi:alkanesulfonate monooxygenase SsuD/methylene tetrahydromethanopterin reductase-like flavin-dependent oxidoreductase (luciferase family)
LRVSRTSHIKLGPSFFLLNLRQPLVAAKAFATLDYLSHGRIVMAVGTGANLADYAACGLPTEGRGRRLDEGIVILRKAWSEASFSFHGKYFNFDNVSIEPRPVRRTNNASGTIDIWVGGRADAALKRTAQFADGYFASFQTPDEFATNLATIRNYAAQFGRADARIESGLILLCRLGTTREKAIEEMRPMLASLGRGAEAFAQRTLFGSPADIIQQLDQYIARGLDKFVLWPVAEPGAWAGQIELIGREIATHYARAAH